MNEQTSTPPAQPTAQTNGIHTTPSSPAPTEWRQALLSRANELFGGGVETIRPDDPRALGPFLDAAKKMAAFEHPVMTVPCGAASGLAVLAFTTDNPAAMQSLVLDNPWLLKTVITTWRTLMFFWVRLDGYRPANRSLPDFYWISDGLIPLADVVADGSGEPVSPTRGQTITTMRFQDFNWPQAIHEIFAAERIVRQYGQVIQLGRGNRQHFSLQAVAHLFAASLGLKYECQSSTFSICAEGSTERIDRRKLAELVAAFLYEEALKADVKFRAIETTDGIMDILKRICGTSEREGLELFLSSRVEQKKGATVTMAELWNSYRTYCEARGAGVYPEREFYIHATASIRSRFGLSKSRDIGRPDASGKTTARAGFRSLAIKEKSSTVADVTDASDGSDTSYAG